jgi:hypothetical protein
LKLSQILSCRQVVLKFLELRPEKIKLFGDFVENETPLFLKLVILFEAATDLSVVFSVMVGDLALSLLKHFDFESTFPGPLLTKVLIKLFDAFILKFLALSSGLLVVLGLLDKEPFKSGA